MGNIFGAPTPPPKPQRIVEYHRPRYQAQPPPPPPRRNVRPANVGALQGPCCLYYTREACDRGLLCPFVHEGDDSQHPAPRPRPNVHQPPHLRRPIREINAQVQKPCRYFAQGRCYKGAQCRFLHDKNRATVVDNQYDQFNGNNTYELGGAWVRFDNGATVSKVSFPSDYKCPIINMQNLPAGCSEVYIMNLLAAAGSSTSPIEIRIFTQKEQNTCSATVKLDDASFIKTACSTLNSLDLCPGLKVSIMPIKLPVSQSPYQVDCRKIHCAWDRPTREANLTYGQKAAALSAHKNLKARGYNMLGSKGKVSYPKIQNNQGKWVIKLEGLSDATKEQDIIEALPKFNRPQTIQLGEPSYVSDLERDSIIVESILLRIGPLERWSVSSDTKTKRFNAYATFLDESSAREAVSSVKDIKVLFSEAAKFSMALVASARFKIQDKIYDTISPQIDKLKTSWTRQHIRVFEIPFKGPFHLLKLECENHKLMVQAKTTLEKLIGGQIIRMDGKDLRCGNFRQNGREYKQIKSIEGSLKVVIIPDVRKSCFRIFGQEECSQSVLDEITTLLQDCTPEGHVIELNDAEFLWASNGGLRLLKSQLGDQKVSFNIYASKNKRIFIRGSKSDYNNAMSIMASKQTISVKKDSSSELECPSCFCDAEDPIRMSCGHAYCSDCFIQMCEAEKTATGEFRISCVKATDPSGTVCQRSFSLSEIQEHLPAEAFEAVLEKSFESYVSRHSGDFTYCQTPDCDQVYRISPPDSEHPITFTCKKCLVSICTFCHISHPGKPCDKAKSIARNILSDKTKEALGIKSCPKCSMLMEKRDGCNHMTCKCGAHVCWVCLLSFNKPQECYDHMNKAHGGFYGH